MEDVDPVETRQLIRVVLPETKMRRQGGRHRSLRLYMSYACLKSLLNQRSVKLVTANAFCRASRVSISAREGRDTDSHVRRLLALLLAGHHVRAQTGQLQLSRGFPVTTAAAGSLAIGDGATADGMEVRRLANQDY
jgi:hypothetical protein